MDPHREVAELDYRIIVPQRYEPPVLHGQANANTRTFF
jgi:hypothetical protein